MNYFIDKTCLHEKRLAPREIWHNQFGFAETGVLIGMSWKWPANASNKFKTIVERMELD